MDFGFTKEQLMFKQEVLRFARKEIVPRVQEHDLASEFDHESFAADPGLRFEKISRRAINAPAIGRS